MKKKSIGKKPHFKKNRISSEFTRVMGQPGKSIEFYRVVAPASLLINPNQFSYRATGPGLIIVLAGI